MACSILPMDWLFERHIEPTRSRPYKKNDNCFAKQKNYDVVRKNVGYFRFDTPEEQAQLAVVYSFLCPLYNYFMPSFRLIDKVQRADGRYKKVYEKEPKTPFVRLIESPDVSEECKAELHRRKALYNPIELNNSLNEAVVKLLKINSEKGILRRRPVRMPLRFLNLSMARFWLLCNHPISARIIIRQCAFRLDNTMFVKYTLLYEKYQ